jgi:hypothetical protein
MAALRRRMYSTAPYILEVEAGDELPPGAQAQARDALASNMEAAYQRARTYLDLALQAVEEKRPDQVKLFFTAGVAALGDLVYENGHYQDAQWIYETANTAVP